MQTFIRTLAAAIVALITLPQLASAADVTPKGGITSDVSIHRGVNWTGPYIGIGAGWEAATFSDDSSSGIRIGEDSAMGYARLGYRHQPAGGSLVFGMMIEGGASALSVEDEIDATYSAILAGDIGLALGSLLVSIEFGYGKTFLEADTLDHDPSGPLVGLKLAADLGGGFEAQLGGRMKLEQDDAGGFELDQRTLTVMGGIGIRF